MTYIKNYIHAHTKSPREMIIFVTNKCNAKCKHCFFWKELNYDMEEMTIEQFKKIANQLNLDYLNLTGGEAFLRDDIVEICKAFNGHTKTVFIPTNGLMTKRILKLVKEIKNSCDFNLCIEVSIDGLKETHDKIRGIPIFDSAIETIKQLKDITQVSVLTTATGLNYKELNELAEFIDSLGVKQGISIIRGNPRDPKANIPLDKIDEVERIVTNLCEKYMPESTTKERLAKELKMKSIKYSIHFLKGHNKKLVPCLAGRDIGVIFPNGDVAFCEMTNPIGNLKESNFNFNKTWNSDIANARRKNMKECYCIQECFLAPSILYNFRVFSHAAWRSIC